MLSTDIAYREKQQQTQGVKNVAMEIQLYYCLTVIFKIRHFRNNINIINNITISINRQ